MSLVRIREVQVLENHRVRLVLTDGAIVERDLAGLLRGPIFDAIRSDEARFREVRVDAGTLVWPNGADLCPDVVIWGGPPPAEVRDTAGPRDYT
jgi:hypothetical protein